MVGFQSVQNKMIYINDMYLSVDGENPATGIESLVPEEITRDAAVYDLMGRPVSRLAKGVYIVGGKKIMMK